MECDVTTKIAYLKPLKINDRQFSNEKSVVLEDWWETKLLDLLKTGILKMEN